ncbi:MAG: PAS domain-containing protein [Sulfurimonas sp.]|nr:PAS domain-containing protein [Sulfurimonas sp.]
MDKVTSLNEEYIYTDEILVSQSDINGKITYANDAFCRVSGYNLDDLIGSTYEIIRHPDMPKAIFEKLWTNINDGQTWTGLIKNLRNTGEYYWDDLSISPIKDENDLITGFISCARPAARKNIKENEALYEKILSSEI